VPFPPFLSTLLAFLPLFTYPDLRRCVFIPLGDNISGANVAAELL
jgi:hypothetical protein